MNYTSLFSNKYKLVIIIPNFYKTNFVKFTKNNKAYINLNMVCGGWFLILHFDNEVVSQLWRICNSFPVVNHLRELECPVIYTSVGLSDFRLFQLLYARGLHSCDCAHKELCG